MQINKTNLALGLASASLILNVIFASLILANSNHFSISALDELHVKKLSIVNENLEPQIILSANSKTGSSIELGTPSKQHLKIFNKATESGISLIDDEQRTRVSVFQNDHEESGINIFNNKNDKSIEIYNNPANSKVTLYRFNTEEKVGIATSKKYSGLFITDERNVNRAGLFYNDQKTNMVFFDKMGRRRLAYSLLGAKPQFALFDSQQRARASLLLHNNKPSFEFYDHFGKIRYKLMEEQNDTIMAFLDPQNNPLVTLGSANNKPEFQVHKD